MYRREYCDKVSFRIFFLPFGRQLSGDNRWIRLAELIPWDELEDDHTAQSARRLVLQPSHFAGPWEL